MHTDEVNAAIQNLSNTTQAIVVNNNADNLLFGQPVYSVMNSSVGLASAAYSYQKDVIGFVVDTILANGGTGLVKLFGILTGTPAQWGMVVPGGLVPNTQYFLDINSGQMITTIPTGDGQHCCPLGKALSITNFAIKIERAITL